VASAAGVTRGAVYWHFRDKGELFGAMCSRATLPLQSRLEQAADGDGDDAIATLHAVSVQAMREIASNPRTRAVLEILLCKSERLTNTADGAPQIDEMDRQCANALERIIVRAIDAGPPARRNRQPSRGTPAAGVFPRRDPALADASRALSTWTPRHRRWWTR
jgi:TetR/AcrR family acrAB operon transcriptional repressor